MGYKVMFLLRWVRGRSRIANQVYFHDFSFKCMKVKVSVTQSCPTLCDPMDCSPPDSSVPGILQARTLEWVAIPFCRGSSWPRDQTWVSCMAGRFFTIWATWEAPNLFFAYGYSIIPASCVEKTIISPLNCLSPLLKINFRYICGLISGFRSGPLI